MKPAIPTAITSLRYVLLGDLVIDHKLWTNPRTITGLSDEDLAELGADIKARGIQVPLIVQKIKTSSGGVTDLVLEGQRRVLAATEVLPRDTEIPVVDRTNEAIEFTSQVADELMLDMLAVATQRDDLSSFELSEVAERLRGREMKLSLISKAIGKHESWVSKILKARSAATPKLMLQWKKGAVTDEQFKELAEVKEPAKQAAAALEIVKARESGDKAEARLRAKEIQETARRGPEKPVVAGPQLGLPHVPQPLPKKATPSRLVLEEMVSLCDKRPPTHDYVKGLMDGVRYANGDLGPDKFARPWAAYLARIDGSGKTKTKTKTRKATKKQAKKSRGKKTGRKS